MLLKYLRFLFNGQRPGALPRPVPGRRPGTGRLEIAELRYFTHLQYHRDFPSVPLGNKRNLIVYLPPSYRLEPQRRYPVLYMHDGNNLFDPYTAFAGYDWRVDDTAQRLMAAGEIEEIIIVGVYNSHRRVEEYTWTRMQISGEIRGGDGPKYGQFLCDELKPFIDRTYRTRAGREDTAVMGSSLGGLISFYLGRYHPDVFGKIGILSPSFWWASRAAFKEVPAFPDDLLIWLDMGTNESIRDHFNSPLQNARDMHRQLLSLGYEDDRNLKYYEDKGAGHNEWYWARRLHLPLKFFFGPGQISPRRAGLSAASPPEGG